MGRPPFCDKVGVKKGPWTPEEDIMLVSYVQEHGPANWRAIPTNTGLRRCSKSCRLRWTNYLRPGIKRGSFTDHEEKMIIQLQALLGNKWAAMASYLPERTDNDIKNYWNTHLKKKLKNGSGEDRSNTGMGFSSNSSESISRGQWERRLQADIHRAKQALHEALSFDHQETGLVSSSQLSDYDMFNPSQTSSYASSTENIARLLKNWVKDPPKYEEESRKSSINTQNSNSSDECKSGIDLSEAFDSLFGFESFEYSDEFSRSGSPTLVHAGERKPDPSSGLAPLSLLENWLLDDQGKDFFG